MTVRARTDAQDLPLADLKRIDSLCDCFEAALQAGERPDAAQFLGEFAGPARDHLFRELLRLELEATRSRGERPDPPSYHARFPEHSEAIEETFALLALDGPSLHPSGKRAATVPVPGASVSRSTEVDGELPPAELKPVVLEALGSAGYEVIGELGRGGMGVVYLARKVALGRLCALKMVLAGAHAGPAALARFRAEAAAIARLQHPDIVQIYHVGEADGLPYLELEYLPGGGLDQALDGSPWPTETAACSVEIMARAIAQAHRQGIVHRDLKPANILLDATGRPKVADFGLAKILDSDDGLTKTRAVLGSPSYMAPEQAEGDARSVAATTDVYALGAILYELLTGRPPVRAATALLTLAQVKETDPVPPSRLQPGMAGDLETICLKCLEKAPARRYATADALAEDLRRFQAGEPILAKPIPSWERAWKWARRRPALAAAVTVSTAALLLLLVGALYYNARLRVSVRLARAAQLEALKQRDRTFRNLNQLVFQVHDKLGKTPATRAARRQVLDTALAGLEEVAESARTAAPDIGRAVAHQKLGDIFREIGRMDDARRQYESARVLAEQLAAAAPRDLAISECQSGTFAGLGDLGLHADQLEQAVQYFRRVVDLAEMNMKINPDRAAARGALLDAYFRLGRAYGFNRELDSSAVWFAKMQHLAERWRQEEPENTLPRDLLSTSYRKLADVWKLSGDAASARGDYLKAVKLGKAVVLAEPANLDYKLHLALALDDLAASQHRLGQFDEASARTRQSEQLFSELVQADPEDVDNQIRLVQTRYHLGCLEMDQIELRAAGDHLRLARDGLRRLDREGKLEGRPRDKDQLLPMFAAEAAACEAVTSPDGAAALKSRPPREAARLLRIRAGALAAAGRPGELAATAEALLDLNAEDSEDLYELGRCLAWCGGRIDEKKWPAPPSHDLKTLRTRLGDRAVALLTRAIDRGLRYPQRASDDVLLGPIRQHPGFRQIAERVNGSITSRKPVLAPDAPATGPSGAGRE
ncbi:MAG: protein kinase domain-containing protein [Isosphaeraceae bacterium]